MGLILCERHSIEHPLYISDMGLRIFSLEELCYVIYNYPLISMDGLVNSRLMGFLKDDLQIGLQVNNLERGFGDWVNYDDVLIAILNFSDYYSTAEIDDFRSRVNELRKIPRYEFYRMKGDLLFSLKQFGKALSYYERSLFDSKDQNADSTYSYRLYRSFGAVYANLYHFDDAFTAFHKALEFHRNDDILKKIYFLAKLEDKIETKQKYLDIIKDNFNSEWDSEYEEVMSAAVNEESRQDLNALDTLDSVRRHKSIEQILNRWKREYRNM